ncbi:hypothetical protein GJ496_001838 [Pomphorhynchus laevis]|nr:hypothetical protein GJ496_001838 [Pomphorhynchus laevis]
MKPTEDDLRQFISKEFGTIIDSSLLSYLTSIPNPKRFSVALYEIFGHNSKPSSIENCVKFYFEPIKNPGDSFNSIVNEQQQTTISRDCEKTNKFKKETNLKCKNTNRKAASVQQCRYECQCEAREHKLIGNCLNCGRIICALEGEGPCLTCGKNFEVLNGTKRFTKINEIEADKQKNKLLEFDRTSAQRTNVIDDESDYFKLGNRWLTKQQRDDLKTLNDELMRRKENSTNVVNIDFVNRQVCEVKEDIYKDIDTKLSEIFKTKLDISVPPDKTSSIPKSLNDIKFVNSESNANYKKIAANSDSIDQNHTSKIQDKEQMLIADLGMCLSVRQPHASLLCLGIKRQEGRSWYTPYRGRLWIHAGAKSPDKDEISKIEKCYQQIRAEKLQFPSHYPLGCIVGYVTISDCIQHDEMDDENIEVDSNFIWICDDPFLLPLMIPLIGQSKIFKINHQVHTALRKLTSAV